MRQVHTSLAAIARALRARIVHFVDEARVELSRSRVTLAAALDVDGTAVSYPFGAAAARERELARAAGYTLGFSLATRWTGDPMAVSRLPVYLWSPPLPGVGALAPIERLGAAGANRFAVGTSVWQRMRKRAD